MKVVRPNTVPVRGRGGATGIMRKPVDGSVSQGTPQVANNLLYLLVIYSFQTFIVIQCNLKDFLCSMNFFPK